MYLTLLKTESHFASHYEYIQMKNQFLIVRTNTIGLQDPVPATVGLSVALCSSSSRVLRLGVSCEI